MRAFNFKGVIFILMEYPYNKKFMNDNDFVALLNESCSECSAEGAEVLMQNLAKIHEYSGELMALLGRGGEVEEWIKDKLSKAAESLSDAKHYVEYRSSAYAAQSHAIDMHGGDTFMGQRDSVAGNSRVQRAPGERMPVMSQVPSMTPQSSMGSAEGDCGVSDGTRDHGRPSLVGPCGDENKSDGDSALMVMMGAEEEPVAEPMGPDVDGMQELPGDEAGPAIAPVQGGTDEFSDDEAEEEDDMAMVSLSEVWGGSKKKGLAEAWQETESLGPEHPYYEEPEITSDYPDEYDLDHKDPRIHLEPKTLADIQGKSGNDEISRMSVDEPHILVQNIKDLAKQKGMKPQEYLRSLGFDESHPVYNMIGKGMLWDPQTLSEVWAQ